MKKIIFGLALIVVVVLALFFYFKPAPIDNAPLDSTATVSIESVSNSNDDLTAAAALSGSKTVTWKTSGYPTDAGVNINLIRKTSDSPITYSLVRTIAQDTPNDGKEQWNLGAGENTGDLYIEITCSTTYQFQNGCQITSGGPIKLN